jgi:heme-degrading monooxygenase HmoA
MVARHWTGLAKTSHADRYEAHLRRETLPSLKVIAGFVDMTVLKREVPLGVEFLVITTWQSMDAIVGFAGTDVERAVVPRVVEDMMVAYDRTVRHYDVIE